MTDPNLSSFIWSVAELLRCDCKQSEYSKVILPFKVLCRLDYILASTKATILSKRELPEEAGIPPEPFLLKKSGVPSARTGGMWSITGEYLAARNPDARLVGSFYVFESPRPLGEIDAELKGINEKILAMFGGLTA